MASVPFHYVEVRAFCYATEDEPRVERAVRRVAGEDAAIDRRTSAGHHGDPITILETRVETADEIRAILGGIIDNPVFSLVESELPQRVDADCSFFLRLDKQSAYQGMIRPGEGIQLRGKVEAYPADRDRAVDNLTAYFSA